MSAVSAAFSSSSLSMRSMNDLRCSFAKPDLAIRVPLRREVWITGAEPSPRSRRRATVPRSLAVSLLRFLESGELFGRRFLLMVFLPFGGRHAVDDFARLVLGQRKTFLGGRLAIPVAQAVAAEIRYDHKVNVLDVSALAQMRDEAAEDGGLEFGAGFLVHLRGSRNRQGACETDFRRAHRGQRFIEDRHQAFGEGFGLRVRGDH